MQKTKKILVPIDFSSCSENALAYAIQLAAKIKATVHLLNITAIDVEDTENSYLVNADPFESWRATKLIKPIQPITIHCIHFNEKQKYMNDKLDKFKAFFC